MLFWGTGQKEKRLLAKGRLSVLEGKKTWEQNVEWVHNAWESAEKFGENSKEIKKTVIWWAWITLGSFPGWKVFSKSLLARYFLSGLEAKKCRNKALSYVYKILMNPLYSWFDNNLKSIITKVCNFKWYNDVVKFDKYINRDMLYKNNFIVSYHTYISKYGTFNTRFP